MEALRNLKARLTKYEVGTPPALALEKQIEKTKTRFAQYGRCRFTLWNRWTTTFNYRWSMESSGEFVFLEYFSFI